MPLVLGDVAAAVGFLKKCIPYVWDFKLRSLHMHPLCAMHDMTCDHNNVVQKADWGQGPHLALTGRYAVKRHQHCVIMMFLMV